MHCGGVCRVATLLAMTLVALPLPAPPITRTPAPTTTSAAAATSTGRFCRSVEAPSATTCHTACDSALRLAKRAGSSGGCSRTVTRNPRAGRSARNATPGPCRRTRRTSAGWHARSAARQAGRRPPRPAGAAADRRPRRSRRTTTAERQHARAVGCGALREQQQIVAGRKPLAHHIALPPGRVALARDEHGAPEPGDGGDERPASHLVLRHEAGMQPSTQHRDVEPRGMVGDEHHRPPVGRPAAAPITRT